MSAVFRESTSPSHLALSVSSALCSCCEMPGNGARPPGSRTSFGAAQKSRSPQVCPEWVASASPHPPQAPHTPCHTTLPHHPTLPHHTTLPITPRFPTLHVGPASPCPGDCGSGTCDDATGTCQCPRGYYGPYCHLRSEHYYKHPHTLTYSNASTVHTYFICICTFASEE